MTNGATDGFRGNQYTAKVVEGHNDQLPNKFNSTAQRKPEPKAASLPFVFKMKTNGRNEDGTYRSPQNEDFGGKTNLTIARQFGVSHAGHGADGKYLSPQNENLGERTNTTIAKQFGVGKSTVVRAEDFVDSLAVADTLAPGFKSSVVSGEIKAPKADRPKMVEAIKRGGIPPYS